MQNQRNCAFVAKFVALAALLLCTGLQLGAQNISARMRNVTVQKAIEYLQREYGYSFSVKTDEVDVSRTVSISAAGADIDGVLAQLFAGQDVEYAVSGKMVTVGASPKSEKAQQKKSKEWILSGKIYDENDDPMVGVVVMEKGIVGKGVSTDINGSFEMTIESGGNAALVVSFIGYEEAEVALSPGQKTIKVKMRPAALFMEEAVVVGYGSMVKKSITSAIGQYKPDDLDRRPVLSPDQFMQGRIAGVNITASSGVPDAATRVSIRGIGSLNAGNEPLWVIDGIPITGTSGDAGVGNGSTTTSNGLININPNDIESIEVLKDASSSAIYGSRATNGVIIVTTKKGKKGAARIDINSSMSVGQALRLDRLEVADADSFIEMLNEGIDNYNIQNGTSVPRYPNPAPGTASHNWENDVVRTAVSHQTSLSISGGSDNMLYYISGGYKHSEGVIKTNDVDQYFLKVNVSGDVKKWLTVGVNSQLSYTDNNRAVTGYSGHNPIKAAMEQNPWQLPKLPNGEWAMITNILIQNNPVQTLEEQDTWVKTYRTISNAFMDFHIIKGLDFKTSLGADYKYIQDHLYYTNKSYIAKPSDENPNGGSLKDGRKSRTTLVWENTLSYDNKFAENLNLSALLGHSYQYDQNDIAYQTGMSFPSPTLDVNSVAASFKDISTTFSEYAMQSFFGRLVLNYHDRYILTGTARADGSSKFAAGHRYGFFPSVSFGWNMDQEQWWPAEDITGKIRASWGKTGNQGDIGAYAYQALAGFGHNYQGNNGLMLSSLGNEDLQWETATQTNVGVDFSFFKGALSLTADVFQKNTDNLLYSKPTMATTGFTTYLCNIGAMTNKGLEFTLNSSLGKGDFHWSGNFNISFVKNKLTKLLDDNETITTGQVNGLKVGEEVGSFYVVKFLGIYQNDDEVPEAFYKQGVRAGDCIYEDVNNDGNIDADDKQFCGSPNPLFTGGFGTNFSYKGFDLNLMFTFSYGNQLYEYLTGALRLGNGTWPAYKSAVESRWTGPGTTNTNPRPFYGGTWNNTKIVNSRFIHDASYLRCRNLTFGYSFPYKAIDKIGLQALKIYFQVDNLFLLTNWPYLDPEVTSYTDATSFGTDWMSIGQPRTFSLGLNIKF